MAKRYPGMNGPSKPGLMPGMNRDEQQKGVPDEGTLPRSKPEVIDRAGIDGTRHIDKHGLKGGLGEMYNALPPGMNIEEQPNASIRKQPFLRFKGLSADGIVRADAENFGAGGGWHREGEDV
jgi:hypothetical protein